MSNFTKDELFEVYDKYLPTFTELASVAVESNVNFELNITSSGKIELISREWYECEGGKRLLTKHYIRQSQDSVCDGSETTQFDT